MRYGTLVWSRRASRTLTLILTLTLTPTPTPSPNLTLTLTLVKAGFEVTVCADAEAMIR
jgi:hypothetical protein